MALTNFIPAVWSGRILQSLDTALVFGAEGVANRDYEGEITGAGSSVKINGIGDITVKSYTKNTDIDAPETLNDAQQTLLIDQQDYFNFQVDSIDAAQTNPKVMDEATRRAAYSLRVKMDSYIAGLYSGVVAGNKITNAGAAIVPTAATAYDYLVDLGVKLDQNDVPDDGMRWVVVTPAFHGLLQKDSRFVASGTSVADGVRANGAVGEAATFKIYKSNQVNVPAANQRLIVAGHPMALTVATQILDVKAYEPERRFGDALKGLHVYGAKLVRPTAAATLLSSL